MICKEIGRKRWYLNLRNHLSIIIEGQSLNYFGRVLRPGPSEYEAAVLIVDCVFWLTEIKKVYGERHKMPL
jgi:hypothetical protein